MEGVRYVILFRFVFLEFKADRVDAIALAALVFRAVIEDVAQMAAAVLAIHFGAMHAMRIIRARADIFRDCRISEGWPAALGIEFRIGREQGIAADLAVIHAVLVIIHVDAFPRRFCAAFA